MSIRFSLLIAVVLLSGCFGGGHYAPVIERKQRLAHIPKTHSVSRGETLYSIAWLYNLDFRGLARTNAIAAPYTIYPGQTIRLNDRAGQAPPKVAVKPAGRVARPPTAAVTSARTTPTATATAARKTPNTVDPVAYPFRWQWPAGKKITRSYSSHSAVHKGIDIQGKFGEPVHAANSGKVVYAGSGLVGFGKLLIIKHNEQYLSAYGHNSKLLVEEGTLVKVGQKIAEFGDTGTDIVKLHFEIRRDGKPINPLKLLPGTK